jgi:hypothetical protein
MTRAHPQRPGRNRPATPSRRHVPAGPGRGPTGAQRRAARRAQAPPPTAGTSHPGKARGWFVTLFWRNARELEHYKGVLANLLLSTRAQSAGIETCPTTGRRHIHVAYNLDGGTSTWNAQRKRFRLPLHLSTGTPTNPPSAPAPAGTTAAGVDDCDELTQDDFDIAANSAANAFNNYGDHAQGYRYACNVQPMKCFKAAHKYVAKDELMAEFSKIPPGQGKRTDIDEFKTGVEDFVAGKCSVKDMWANHFQCMLRYGKGFQKCVNDHQDARDFCTFMLVIHGPPNSGKTSWVKKMFNPDVLTFNPSSNFFSLPENPRSTVCLFDDPDLGSWSASTIKALSNHAELSVNVKGGYRQFTYKLIVITINELPNNPTWDEAVQQRLGLSSQGERGSLISWPDASVNAGGNREVLVPVALADECHQCRDIRGPHCFSKPWEYSTCCCPASLRTYSVEGTACCESIYLQKNYGPGATFVIPKGAPQGSFLTAANRLRLDVQQPEPQAQQPDAQPQDSQPDSSDGSGMEDEEDDPVAEDGYSSGEANRLRALYDVNRAQRGRTGLMALSAVQALSDSDSDSEDEGGSSGAPRNCPPSWDRSV